MNIEFNAENFNKLVGQVNDLNNILHTYQAVVLVCLLFMFIIQVVDLVVPYILKWKNKKYNKNE